jgi:hypothetical protein
MWRRKNLFHLPLGKFHSNEFLFLSEIDTSFSCACYHGESIKIDEENLSLGNAMSFI